NNLNDLKAGSSAEDLAEAQANVDKAQRKLDELKAGPTESELTEAQANVTKAEASLQKLREPATESDVASAEADVVQAQVALDDARHDLEGATLKAPFDGMVADVKAVVGSVAKENDEAVAITDDASMHLDIELSETDIARVKVGQAASITFDAIEGKTMTGTVTSVAPSATSGGDVVTYLVQVQFNPDALAVRVGMSANATILVESRQGVIQVPNRAIKSQGPFKTVQVLYGKDQKPVTVQVQTGATNGQMTEIVSCRETNNQCLRAGDQVALNVPTGSGSQEGPGGMVRFEGGAMPIGVPGDKVFVKPAP
ncbi:MAG TPA: efflux RND transporter periplasmic adaptor subunit, partial [Chloroflexia bacterium]|nr:efflux RND transporter periplasmic adaptor subunit [Chloroflexia bacterium]